MNLTRLLFAFALVLPAGAAEAAETIPPLKFAQRTLANGLQFIWLEDHTAPTAALAVWYRVGSKNDPDGRSGFAHLFEHMMFKSTKRMPSEFLDRLTEDVGGENNAYTMDDVTVYHETVPSNHLERLLWAEAERLSSLTLDVHNFTLEREVVKEEFRQSVLAEPYGEFGEDIMKKSFTAHPYKRPTIGNIEELDASSLDEVRAFHTTFYRPDNALLVVVGDFEPAQLQRWVDAYFGPVARPETPIPRVTTLEPARTAAQTSHETSAKVPLPALAVTYLGPTVASEEAPALEVLARVLSGGDSSRLFRSLIYRQQLAQSAEFSADLRADLGLLIFQLVLASGVEIEQAEAALQREIHLLREHGISPAELETAKNQLLSEKLQKRETCAGKAAALASAATLLGDPERANRSLTDLQAVTAAQVQAAACKWLTEANQLTLECLPKKQKPPAEDQP